MSPEEVLYLARASSIGLILQVADIKKARMRLYSVRARLADESLSDLQFRLSPFPEGNLLIINRRIEMRTLTNGGTDV